MEIAVRLIGALHVPQSGGQLLADLDLGIIVTVEIKAVVPVEAGGTLLTQLGLNPLHRLLEVGDKEIHGGDDLHGIHPVVRKGVHLFGHRQGNPFPQFHRGIGVVASLGGVHQRLTGHQGLPLPHQAVVVLQRHHKHLPGIGHGLHVVGAEEHVVHDHPVLLTHPHKAAHPVVQDVAGGGAILLRRLFSQHPHLLLVGAVQGVHTVHHGVQVDVAGVAVTDAVLNADVQAGGGGDHHQHHGAQDADGGQARAIAFHAVDHGGHRHEVVGLVIVPLILLQQAAQGHRARHKQQVGAHHHHGHRDEEANHGGNGVFHGDGPVVGPGQHHQAQQGEDPVGTGRLLSGVLTA